MRKAEASPLRRAAMQALQIALTLGLVAWIVRRIGLRTLTERLLAADPWWLAMAIGAFVLSLVLGTLQWDRLLRHQGVRLRFLEALRIYVLGMFLNGVLPSGVGGDVVRAIQVQREARRGGTGLAATFLDRFAGLFSLALFAFVASLVLQAGEHDPVFERLVGLIGLAFVSFCAVAAVLFSRRATAWLEPVARLLGEGRIRDLMRDLRRAFLHYRTSGPLVWQVVVLSLSVQLLRILVHYHASNALGLGIGLGWFMLFVPLVALVSVLPISVGGWGPREGLQQYLFALPGVMTAVPAAQASASALALALLTSLLGLLIPAALGIVLGLSTFRSVRHARRREPLAT